MNLSPNQIMYIAVITCLFTILNLVIIMKNRIQSFSVIVILISIISFIVLGTLSAIKKN